VVWPDGVIYEGMLKNGLKHGRGVHTLADGSVYEGNFKKGLKDGKGVMTYATDGQALNFLWSAGDKYDGEFQSDKRHGNCTYTFFNGDVLQCSWRDDICPEFSQRQAALLNAASRATPEARGMQSAVAGSMKEGQVRMSPSFTPAPPPHILPCSLSHFSHRVRKSVLTLTITPPHTASAPGQSSARRRQRMLPHVIMSGACGAAAPAPKPNGKNGGGQRGIS
jgi:hypothetical protein